MIDLRSDTVTRPTPAMRKAMAEAELGDDVFGGDPTVLALEAETAALLGQEAALYVPSGTMSNQIAVHLHCRPGDQALMDQGAHIAVVEGGAPAALTGVTTKALPGVRGIFTEADVAAHFPTPYPDFPAAMLPRSSLLSLENTSNSGGGSVWPIDRLEAVAAAGRRHGMKLHLDGARLWNAAAATGIPEARWAKPFDTISVCFSKGLGAPVGSALAGSKATIAEARRIRARHGGGMRQAGVIAAGALHALRHHRARLAEDHENAGILARGLAALPGIDLDPATVETNIVRFRVTSMPAAELAGRLKAAGVWMLPGGPDALRAVAHLDVGREQILAAVEAAGRVLTAA